MAKNVLYLYEVNAVGGKPFLALISQAYKYGTYWYYLSWAFFADPILHIFANYHYEVTGHRKLVQVVDKNPSKTGVSHRSTYLYGIRLLFHVLAMRHIKRRQNWGIPTWNARRALHMWGETSFISKDPVRVVDLMQAFSLPAGISDVYFQLTRLRNGVGFVDHISFDQLRFNARALQPHVGQKFKRLVGSLNRYGEFVLNSLVITNDTITYEMKDILYVSYPSSVNLKISSLTVKIQRITDPSNNDAFKVTLFGLENVGVGKYNTKIDHGWFDHAYGFPKYLTTEDPAIAGKPDSISLEHAMPQRIMGATGGLYHTQSHALGKVLPELSKNFENFTEISQTLGLFKTVWTEGGNLYRVMTKSGLAGQAWYCLKLITGGILMYNFALRPTVDAIGKLADEAIIPVKGEGAMSFEGSDIQDLRPTLKSFIADSLWHIGIQVPAIEITWFRVDFRSEVTMKPSFQDLATFLVNSNWLTRSGIIPSPLGLYQTTRMSFVVDWKIPVGKTIEHAQSYFSAMPFPSRIGHTVRIQLMISDGRCIDAFLRTNLTEIFIDPIGDSWLEAPGFPQIAIPLAISQVITGLEST
jgi:hypothetical protein